MSLFDLTDKVAIVTGSSRGIGQAIAERMAEHGARVVVSSRKQDACDTVTRAIQAKGGQAATKTCNIGHKHELQALADFTVQHWGRVDILVCNAAVNPYFGPALNASDDAYDRTMNHNVRSNFWLCNLVAPAMAARGGGAIIIVSSIAGLRGSAELGIYALSKAADLQLARNLAVEWGPHNVRANCIAPGLIRTDFARVLWENPEALRRRNRDTPLRRIGEPDELAGAAVFLASSAATFMTGQTLIIDGGVLAGVPLAAKE